METPPYTFVLKLLTAPIAENHNVIRLIKLYSTISKLNHFFIFYKILHIFNIMINENINRIDIVIAMIMLVAQSKKSYLTNYKDDIERLITVYIPHHINELRCEHYSTIISVIMKYVLLNNIIDYCRIYDAMKSIEIIDSVFLSDEKYIKIQLLLLCNLSCCHIFTKQFNICEIVTKLLKLYKIDQYQVIVTIVLINIYQNNDECSLISNFVIDNQFSNKNTESIKNIELNLNILKFLAILAKNPKTVGLLESNINVKEYIMSFLKNQKYSNLTQINSYIVSIIYFLINNDDNTKQYFADIKTITAIIDSANTQCTSYNYLVKQGKYY